MPLVRDPYFRLLIQFALVFGLCDVLLMVLRGLTGQGGTVTALVPLMTAALYGGTRVYRLLGRRPDPATAWQMGAAFSLASFLVSLPIMAIVFLRAPDLAALLSGLPLMVGAAGYVALGTVLCRIGLGIGSGLAERRARGGGT